ncbi:MAG: hypothetical protein JO065_07940, partial [Acidobacteria bacterium]|nr:hypothetical protein [Acidobacteriota bacterium]
MWTPAGAGGGEGYGWGAVLPAHIMRNIIGARESEKQDAFWLCPNLPAEFMIPFKRYVLRNWQYGDLKLMIRYSVESEQGEILADIIGLPAGNRNAVFDQNGKPMQNINAGPTAFSFTAKNRQRYQVKPGLPRDRQNRSQ